MADEASEQVEQAAPQHSWEWVGEPPSLDEVEAKLKGLPPWWHLEPAEYVEFIQPLSQTKNMSLEKGRKEYATVWTLYVTVAGRVRMVNDAAEANGWVVEFEPEPVTPTGIPGYLVYDEGGDEDAGRVVYREYVSIWEKTDDGAILLGRRPGTAWVPFSGGGGAIASNRWEKVETSARGRALAAWGFGVLPGSGIASLEEMQAAAEYAAAGQSAPARRQRREAPKREDVESTLRQALVDYQDVTGVNDETMHDKVQSFVGRMFDKEVGLTEKGAYDFSPLKDGEVTLIASRIAAEVKKLRAEQTEL